LFSLKPWCLPVKAKSSKSKRRPSLKIYWYQPVVPLEAAGAGAEGALGKLLAHISSYARSRKLAGIRISLLTPFPDSELESLVFISGRTLCT